MHTIESSNLDADFSPGEKTTNAPAELDEIWAQVVKTNHYLSHH
jgi:hypothetical protein